MDTKNVLNLLLLHLSSHRERVLAGIRMLVEVNFPVASIESKASPLNSDQRIVSLFSELNSPPNIQDYHFLACPCILF